MEHFETSLNKERSQMLVYFVIDSSKNMNHGRISLINEAMAQVKRQLTKIEQNEGCEILVAPLVFSDDAKWVGLKNEKPVRVADFEWNDIEAQGEANLGKALNELAKKIENKEKGGWMPDDIYGIKPIVILISSGESADDWKESLCELEKLDWFRFSIKYAISIANFQETEEINLALAQYPVNIRDIETIHRNLSELIKAIYGCLKEEPIKEDDDIEYWDPSEDLFDIIVLEPQNQEEYGRHDIIEDWDPSDGQFDIVECEPQNQEEDGKSENDAPAQPINNEEGTTKDLFEIEGKHFLQLFISPLIDKSGSMYSILPQINEAIKELMPIFEEIAQNEATEMCFVPIGFSHKAEWLRTPKQSWNFEWDETCLEAGGGTDFKAAYDLLLDKLRDETEGGWVNRRSAIGPPILLLVTDGCPYPGWEKSLAQLNKNKIFQKAIKYAIVLEEEVRNEVLAFTESRDAIYCSDEKGVKELFMKIIIGAIVEMQETYNSVDSMLSFEMYDDAYINKKDEIIKRINERIKNLDLNEG